METIKSVIGEDNLDGILNIFGLDNLKLMDIFGFNATNNDQKDTKYLSSKQKILSSSESEVKTIKRKPIIHEKVKKDVTREIQQVIHREIEEIEIRRVVQPIHETFTTQLQVSEQTTEEHISWRSPFNREEIINEITNSIQEKSSVEYETKTTVIYKEPIIIEKRIRNIITEIQPIIYREVIQSEIIKATETSDVDLNINLNGAHNLVNVGGVGSISVDFGAGVGVGFKTTEDSEKYNFPSSIPSN